MRGIEELLKEYAISDANSAELLRESADNIVYTVGKNNKSILRISKRLSVKELEFEFAAIEYLAKNGFPVPVWIKTRDGKISIRDNEAAVVVFGFLDGYKAKSDKNNLPNRNQCRTAGINLALLHNLGLNFRTDFTKKRNVFTEFERAIKRRDVFMGQFESGREFMGQVENAVKLARESKETNGLIHNDFRPGNVIFKNDGRISGVIDFDWSCYGPIIKDLALAVAEWSFPDGRTEVDWELFDSFLEGYNSIAENKYEKGRLLYFWIEFAMLSDACTYFCDLADDKILGNKVIKSYMYKKYIYFSNIRKQIS